MEHIQLCWFFEELIIQQLELARLVRLVRQQLVRRQLIRQQLTALKLAKQLLAEQ
jgi:hypothetical protein